MTQRRNCEYCNGTGLVPKGYQHKKRWWETEPLSGEDWAKLRNETCEECNGTGRGPRLGVMTNVDELEEFM